MLDFKGAIFDLDGTIIDSLSVWEDIDRKFFEKRNIIMPLDYISKVNSMSFEDSVICTIERFNLKESKEDIIRELNEMVIYEYSYNIKLKPNVKEYLRKLKKNNIKIGLATMSSKDLYEPVLKNNKIYDYFDTFTTIKEVGKDKNHPDVYLLAAKRLGLNPCECIGFEDILIGINTLKKAGFKAIGVYDKYSVENLEEIKRSCDKFINDFKELLD